MPRPRVAMRRIGEVLRLKYELGLSESEIARGARLARSTVREYLDRAEASGLGYDEACGLADEELDRRLFAARDARDMDGRPNSVDAFTESIAAGTVVTLGYMSDIIPVLAGCCCI